MEFTLDTIWVCWAEDDFLSQGEGWRAQFVRTPGGFYQTSPYASKETAMEAARSICDEYEAPHSMIEVDD